MRWPLWSPICKEQIWEPQTWAKLKWPYLQLDFEHSSWLIYAYHWIMATTSLTLCTTGQKHEFGSLCVLKIMLDLQDCISDTASRGSIAYSQIVENMGRVMLSCDRLTSQRIEDPHLAFPSHCWQRTMQFLCCSFWNSSIEALHVGFWLNYVLYDVNICNWGFVCCVVSRINSTSPCSHLRGWQRLSHFNYKGYMFGYLPLI